MFILGTAGSWLASCAAVCACQACQCVTKEMLRKSARLAYCALFTLAMVLAWILRDFAKPLIEKIPCEALLLGVMLLQQACVLCVSAAYKASCERHGIAFCLLLYSVFWHAASCTWAVLQTCSLQGLCTRPLETSVTAGTGSRLCTDSAWATL